MPRYASVAGRLVSRMRLAPSRRERQLHPDVGARVAVVVGDLPEPVARGRAAPRPRAGSRCRGAALRPPSARASSSTRAISRSARPRPRHAGRSHMRLSSATPGDRGGAPPRSRRPRRRDRRRSASRPPRRRTRPASRPRRGRGRRVHVLAQEREVLGQLAGHPRVIVGARAADLVVLGHLALSGRARRARAARGTRSRPGACRPSARARRAGRSAGSRT